MNKQIDAFRDIVSRSKNIVFFGGAGVSTASGIPDFRSSDGIYNRKYDYPPEVMISHSFYRRHPEEFFEFYKNNMIFADAQPNTAHTKLAQWEQEGKLSAIVTQNIDGLHQKAGSKKVLELHGSVLRNYCEDCKTFHDLDYILASKKVPRCTQCSGMVKPDVVLYEEQLDQTTIQESINAISSADLLIVGGTSLTVYPAAGFISAFGGNTLVIVNMSPTSQDRNADLVVSGDIAKVFSQLP